MKRPITVLLVLANLLAYAAELAGGVADTCQTRGLVPATFLHSGDLLPVLSSLFLHASLGHLAGNLVVLAVFGAVVEGELGGLRMLALYLAAGVVGALLHVLVDPASTDALVGASGAIFGVLAVAGAARPRLLGFIIPLAAINVWYAFSGTGGEVSFACHLGGLAVGCLFAATTRAAGTLETA